MSNLGDILTLTYGFVCFCVAIYLVVLAARFVNAHQRMADALDKLAGKQSDANKKG